MKLQRCRGTSFGSNKKNTPLAHPVLCLAEEQSLLKFCRRLAHPTQLKQNSQLSHDNVGAGVGVSETQVLRLLFVSTLQLQRVVHCWVDLRVGGKLSGFRGAPDMRCVIRLSPSGLLKRFPSSSNRVYSKRVFSFVRYDLEFSGDPG